MSDVTTTPGHSAPPDELLRWTIVALYGLMVLAAVAVVSDGLELKFLRDVASGIYNGQQGVVGIGEAIDDRQRAIGIVQLIVRITTAILVGSWIYRANQGARALGANDMTFTPGWSVGWYFVPVANLFKPYQAMREIWCASANPTDWHTVTPPAKLGWWWALWLASTTITKICYHIALGIDGINGAIASSAVTLASDLVDIPLCLVLISIVREIAANQGAARRFNSEPH